MEASSKQHDDTVCIHEIETYSCTICNGRQRREQKAAELRRKQVPWWLFDKDQPKRRFDDIPESRSLHSLRNFDSTSRGRLSYNDNNRFRDNTK